MKMVEVLWADDTTRKVEEGALLLSEEGELVIAKDGGFVFNSAATCSNNPHFFKWSKTQPRFRASRVVEVEEELPPIVVQVPTLPGAIIKNTRSGILYTLVHDYGYNVWVYVDTLGASKSVSTSFIESLFEDGVMRVISEGVDLNM